MTLSSNYVCHDIFVGLKRRNMELYTQTQTLDVYIQALIRI